MQKLPVFNTINKSLIFIKKNYKISLSFITFITIIQYSQNLIQFINPAYGFAIGIAFLFYYAFINPLFKIKESETPTDFVKRYALSGLIYANVVLMAFVLYDIYNVSLFYFIIYGISLYISYFFIIRFYFKKKKLFDKKIFIASIKKMVAIMLIIFAGFMIMYFTYKFLIFILQYAAIPEFIQTYFITHKTFMEYAHYSSVIIIYGVIFVSFTVSCFAWISEVEEEEGSISYSFLNLGKNFFRVAGIIVSIYLIAFGINYLLYLIPIDFYLLHRIINSTMILLSFITFLETYKFIYKQKK